MAPVPRKLAERIWQWEFVDMGEMLSDNWLQKGDEPTVNPLGLAHQKRQVTDINTWIRCFATFTSMMSCKCPETMPELQVSIMKASSEYSGLAWAQYDSAYRHQAANTGNRSWSHINPSLYSVCFTGKANTVARCSLCASMDHTVKDCPFSTKTDMERTLEPVFTACIPKASGAGASSNTPSTEVCRRWNEMRCTHPWCRYQHVCLACGGGHPVKQGPCDASQIPQGWNSTTRVTLAGVAEATCFRHKSILR